MFYYGIYNQLADDLADMFDDQKDGAVTPYTYYLTYYQTRKDLINPFEMYWTVISYLIHDVYHSDSKTQEVILDRAINGLKRLKEKLGEQKYSDLMGILTTVPILNVQKIDSSAVIAISSPRVHSVFKVNVGIKFLIKIPFL